MHFAIGKNGFSATTAACGRAFLGSLSFVLLIKVNVDYSGRSEGVFDPLSGPHSHARQVARAREEENDCWSVIIHLLAHSFSVSYEG